MPIKGMAEFNLSVRDFLERLPAKLVVRAHKKIALEGLRGVVEKTPVDTGRARGNWQLSVGESPEGETGLLDGSTRDLAGDEGSSAAVTRGLAKIAGLQPYATIFIGNNVPYIVPLEEGHSKQAPRGMVGLTLAELEAHYADPVMLETLPGPGGEV